MSVNNTSDCAAYFAEFLVQFFAAHSNLPKNKLYIFGESFAGHYIPAISSLILTNDKLKLKTKILFNVAGLVDYFRMNSAQNISCNA